MSQVLRQHIEKTVSLSDEEFDYVLSHFTPKQFRKHQFLVQEGDLVQQKYFIVQGLTKSFFIDETGKEHILHFAMDSDWVTDGQAFELGEKSTLHINCIENTEVLTITRDNLEKLCARLDKMQYFFRKKATADNVQLQRRIQCLITNNAANRYHDFVTSNPRLIQRVPKKMIASYLGVSRETLSRLLPQ